MPVIVRFDRSSPVPLYHQLATQLKQKIGAGELEKGSLLGNEVDLAAAWKISRPTVRRAIAELVDDGLLVRRRGIGTQVVTNDVRRRFALSSLHDDLVQEGRQSSCDVLAVELRVAPDEVAGELETAPGADVLYVSRVRFADGLPLAATENWLIAELAEHLTEESLATSGLYESLRLLGVSPHSAIQRVGAKAASPDEADLLDLEPGSPLVTMHRVMKDTTGRVIEVADTVYDAGQYAVEMSVVEK